MHQAYPVVGDHSRCAACEIVRDVSVAREEPDFDTVSVHTLHSVVSTAVAVEGRAIAVRSSCLDPAAVVSLAVVVTRIAGLQTAGGHGAAGVRVQGHLVR